MSFYYSTEVEIGLTLCILLTSITLFHRADKEAFLSKISRDNVQLLINQIFQLPTAKVDNEIVIKLPAGTTRLPRAKPAPKAKELTKWEKYAKEKGITKRKKANTEWDEELQVKQQFIIAFLCKPFFNHYILLLYRDGCPDLDSKRMLQKKRKAG